MFIHFFVVREIFFLFSSIANPRDYFSTSLIPRLVGITMNIYYLLSAIKKKNPISTHSSYEFPLSFPSFLSVKPNFLRGPKDTVTLTDRKVEFECQVSGDPPPQVSWRRLRGPLPEDRTEILDDHTLRFAFF